MGVGAVAMLDPISSARCRKGEMADIDIKLPKLQIDHPFHTNIRQILPIEQYVCRA